MNEQPKRTAFQTVATPYVDEIKNDLFLVSYSPNTGFAPDILSEQAHQYDRKVSLLLDGKPCTQASKLAFVEALRDWLQARYDAGDRTYHGLSAFVEQARIEYLQPEGMAC